MKNKILKLFNDFRADIHFEKKLRDFNMKFYTTWGLFSPKSVDEGSELLINSLDIEPDDVSLDLGCGYGAIGLTIAKLSPKGGVHMIDKDFVAIDYSRKNMFLNNINNCKIYLSNVFDEVYSIKFDNIVSNLPAKINKELYWIIIKDAKKHLKPRGKFYVVTISGLREFIKQEFKKTFGNYEKLKQGKIYTVSMAINNEPKNTK